MNKRIISLIVLFFLILPLHAGINHFWAFHDHSHVPVDGGQAIFPDDYQVATLDHAALLPFLHQLGSSPDAAGKMALPLPNGHLADFKIWNTPIMEPELQGKFPGIQTFTAVSLNDPTVTAKIDFTEKGFHAMVYDGDQTFLINPYNNEVNGFYIVYYKNRLARPAGKRMACEVGDDDDLRPLNAVREVLSEGMPGMALKKSGTERKNYRLALSCTGEYAIAVAGNNPSKADVLSAMVTTINRVNGIYEREVAVTMTLIGNNDLIIYTDPGTDPFTGNANNQGGVLLDMNHNNLNTVIGLENYDIGHIFSTGGGGIASLQSVCFANAKGKGVTGLSDPRGDGFDVDYVAHEIGHQFGAEHTFNANSGVCFGNGVEEAAYEPGGASTVMSYAGLCGSNNIQKHSSDYFHAISLDQISDFLVLNYGGNYGGGACGAIENNIALPPELPSVGAFYRIPFKTPFELEAPVADDGDSPTITYNWEQWDLGDFQKNENTSANFTEGPTFRSYPPVKSRWRVFPKIDSIVNNNNSFVGERLPASPRFMGFKVTARHIVDGWGAFNTSSSKVSVQVIPTGTPFAVTHPNTSGVTWQGNTVEEITWDVAQTNVAPVNCSYVNIYLSTDGGFTYPFLLAENLPNTGTANIAVPDVGTARGRIKVKGAGNIFFDISNYDITITGKENSLKKVNILDTQVRIFPNPASDYLNIINESHATLHLNLTTVTGRTVWRGDMFAIADIPVGQLAGGIYLLHIENTAEGLKTVKKIIVQ